MSRSKSGRTGALLAPVLVLVAATVPHLALAAPASTEPSAASPAAATTSTRTEALGPRGPTLATDRAGVARRDDSARTAGRGDAADVNVGVGPNIALMVVGAAGIVAGALIGGGAGTAVAVGGAAVGLYGLYRLLR